MSLFRSPLLSSPLSPKDPRSAWKEKKWCYKRLKKLDGGSIGVNNGGLGVNSGGLDIVNGSLARWRKLNKLYCGVLGWWSRPQR
ncbi:hypothetical protein DY000_02060936 [Brassica cretica]|uniref:Uncharacterized protein n=1 Tax=Brassica cretica TaxID=69181 RepID=A0ABQ7B3F7_BRACR|nr:hypothetical protein DY000_02060936 [Brassica cretica]